MTTYNTTTQRFRFDLRWDGDSGDLIYVNNDNGGAVVHPSTGTRPDYVCLTLSFVNPSLAASETATHGGWRLCVEFYDWEGNDAGAYGFAYVQVDTGTNFSENVQIEVPVMWHAGAQYGDEHPSASKVTDWSAMRVFGAYPLAESSPPVNTLDWFDDFDLIEVDLLAISAGDCAGIPTPQLTCGQKPYSVSLIPGMPGYPGVPEKLAIEPYCTDPACNYRHVITREYNDPNRNSGFIEQSITTCSVAILGTGGNLANSGDNLEGCSRNVSRKITFTGDTKPTFFVSDTLAAGGAGCISRGLWGGYSCYQMQSKVWGQPNNNVSESVERVCGEPTCFPGRPYEPAVPGIPPTPDQLVYDYDLGWNFDVYGCPANGKKVTITASDIEFDVSGIIIGLVEAGRVGQIGVSKYRAYLLFEVEKVRAFVDGVEVIAAEARGSDSYSVAHGGDAVRIYKNSTLVDEVTGVTGDTVFMSTIYRGGDAYCFDCSALTNETIISNTGGLEKSIGPLTVLGSDGEGGKGYIGPLGISNSGNLGAFYDAMVATIGPLTFNNSNRSSGLQIGPLTMWAEGGLPIPEQPVRADMWMWPLGFQAQGSWSAGEGVNSQIGPLLLHTANGSNLTIGPLDCLIMQYPRYDGELSGTFEFFDGDLWGYVGGDDGFIKTLNGLTGNLYGGAYLSQTIQFTGELSGTAANVGRFDLTFNRLVMTSSTMTGVIGEMDVTSLAFELTGELFGGATLDGTFDQIVGDLDGIAGTVGVFDGDLQLVGELTGRADEPNSLIGDLGPILPLWGILDGEIEWLDGEFVENVTVSEYRAWVMNLVHQGVTTYPDYGMEFIVRWRGRHYLANTTGLFLHGGDKDVTANISASVGLPESDYGLSREKVSPRLYYQGKASGNMTVTVQADQGTPVTVTADGKLGTNYWRAKLPRGVKGHHLQYTIANVNGADFELEAVDLLVHNAGRKI